MVLMKSANDSLSDVFIHWKNKHTLYTDSSHTHTEICKHIFKGKNSAKGLNFNK